MFEGLVINLNNEVVIKGDNSAFEGTPFYGKDFSITVNPVSHKEYDYLKRQYTNRKNKEINEAAFEKALFMKQIKNWSNFRDEKGKEIPYSDKVKEAIADQILFFTRAVNIACLTVRTEANEEEIKN